MAAGVPRRPTSPIHHTPVGASKDSVKSSKSASSSTTKSPLPSPGLSPKLFMGMPGFGMMPGLGMSNWGSPLGSPYGGAGSGYSDPIDEFKSMVTLNPAAGIPDTAGLQSNVILPAGFNAVAAKSQNKKPATQAQQQSAKLAQGGVQKRGAQVQQQSNKGGGASELERIANEIVREQVAANAMAGMYGGGGLQAQKSVRFSDLPQLVKGQDGIMTVKAASPARATSSGFYGSKDVLADIIGEAFEAIDEEPLQPAKTAAQWLHA